MVFWRDFGGFWYRGIRWEAVLLFRKRVLVMIAAFYTLAVRLSLSADL